MTAVQDEGLKECSFAPLPILGCTNLITRHKEKLCLYRKILEFFTVYI